MSVIIRCRRTGANNDPCFRIVAADKRSPRDGKCLETLGWYDPKKKKNNFFLNLARIKDLKEQGAQISATVLSLMRKAKTMPMAAPAAATQMPAADASVPAATV